MNPPTEKHLNLGSIYTVLAIGFALLLFLIGLIGMDSSSKLNDISVSAGRSADDYMDRLTMALGIREAAREVVSEARLFRARQAMKVWNPTFRTELNDAKERFQIQIKMGNSLWKGKEPTLSIAEVEAWRNVESASEKFMEVLARAEKLKNPEDVTSDSESNQKDNKRKDKKDNKDNKKNNQKNNQKDKARAKSEPIPTPTVAPDGQTQLNSQDNPDQGSDQEVEMVQTDFLKLRIDLDNSAKNLTDAVIDVQKRILHEFRDQQQHAASEIKRTTIITWALGLLVAILTFILARNQIVQLRQASRQEQEAKDFARSIFDSQSNDILVVNNKGELLAVNQAFLNHYDLPALSEDINDHRAVLTRLPEVADFVDKTLAQPDDTSNLRERLEVKPFDRHSGDTRLLDIYTSPLTIGGETGGRVIVILDVTEAEQVREELRRSRTLSAVGQITATVAHELYNPIGAVKLNLDLLEMQIAAGDDLNGVVARLKRGVDHLSTIVMDLRHLTRTRDPERQTTNLNQLLDEVVELASDRLERSRICIGRDYASDLPHGEFDQQQLRKVFLNLLINAVEASPQNSDVELRTRFVSRDGSATPTETIADRAALMVSVVDRGVGMSLETKKRLFEAFYTTKHNGTGLGMMITQEIVKKHGGKIEVESEEGMGTTVSVYLPV